MKILFVHNHYGDGVGGGEEILTKRQSLLLNSYGHQVYEYYRKNSEFINLSIYKKIIFSKNLIYSKKSYHDIQKIIKYFKPDIMHVHNFWMILSPSIFQAAKDLGVSTVINLNNYRLTGCINGLMLRNGNICSLCLGKNPWRAVLYKCYSNNFTASIIKYLMYTNSIYNKIWLKYIDAFVVGTEFGKKLFISNKIPKSKLFTIPNFIEDPLSKSGYIKPGFGALIISRLSQEKGLLTIVKAWNNIKYPLTVVGDGPLRSELNKCSNKNIIFTGYINNTKLDELYNKSAFTIFPSECYEGFGLTTIESMAYCRPVIGVNLGTRKEIIKNGYNGLLYELKNIVDLQNKVRMLVENKNLLNQMSKNARKTYDDYYTPKVVYNKFSSMYSKLINI
jgi:glycosyltransferase involved in cell wall biosynthesis